MKGGYPMTRSMNLKRHGGKEVDISHLSSSSDQVPNDILNLL